MNTFGEKLRQLRIGAGLTQDALAQKCGMAKQSISRYEKSDREPNIRTAKTIADALGVPLAALVPTKDLVADVKKSPKEEQHEILLMLFALLSFYFYYWMGSTLEQYWGTPQFNIFMLLGWFFTVTFGFAVYFITGHSPQITGTYLYYSLFFSYATLFPEMQVMLFMLLPVKMKWLAVVDGLFFAWSVLSGFAWFPENLLPLVAVLNYFVFFGGELWQRRPRKASAETVNFRRESARIRREQRSELYRHKCAVCGRTDVSNPELEFRYCSRCAGYHCFCQDHIDNHIHFTE